MDTSTYGSLKEKGLSISDDMRGFQNNDPKHTVPSEKDGGNNTPSLHRKSWCLQNNDLDEKNDENTASKLVSLQQDNDPKHTVLNEKDSNKKMIQTVPSEKNGNENTAS
ncbi:hypothetical protein RCL_jg14398.t1 [Rhizophagus clarus]|uniref:Uncharacterized protein n=1 Tax=Rhizophagus clarus TaxID=94130 RepID=A0A8H3QS53_9GLOM|nr:hypothetical protein RCL_jg14398.t1 [Rhizophagus clarus]